MRLSLRFIIPLLIAIGAAAYVAVPLADSLILRWFVRDIDMRSSLIASTVHDSLVNLIQEGASVRIVQLFGGLLHDERLYAVGLCVAGNNNSIATPNFPQSIDCASVRAIDGQAQSLMHIGTRTLHIAVERVEAPGAPDAWLALIHDMSFVERRNEEIQRYLFYFFVALGAAVALITVVIAQISWRGWVRGLRALLRGEGILRPAIATTVPELRPIAHDLRDLIRDLERQYRPLDGSQRIWDQQALRATLRSELHGNNVIAVSNREPYIHVRGEDGGVRIRHPASGLVTALEPVMRACSGTWIAHGSGSADRDTVDRHDRVEVPPGHPLYQIRRIWLTPEEEAGYYAGFANEGLWPLCHIAHVRPTFRTSDYEYYRKVNQKFADAVVDEATTSDPVVLVQDYHFALLPRMIRERLPDATILTFWHIPWPNPEAFAICPWSNELLDGMLGSSILGFHTQFHCNNFLDTVDRLLEARVDRESFTISFRGQPTAVHRYPISIEWPPAALAAVPPVPEARRAVRERLGLPASHRLGIGIDRLDYTKGIIERFSAVARLLELEPRWAGRFTFVQIASPSRDSHRRLPELCDTRARAGCRNQPEVVARQPSADHAAHRAPRNGGRLRVSPRRGPVLRQQPARRHESRRQGVRRRARR